MPNIDHGFARSFHPPACTCVKCELHRKFGRPRTGPPGIESLRSQPAGPKISESQRNSTGVRRFAIGIAFTAVALSIAIMACDLGAHIDRHIPISENAPTASQASAGPSLPVAPTATIQPTPYPTYTAIPTPTATPAPTPQPMYTPYPSPGPADTPTPGPVATPEPAHAPSPTTPMVTPTPGPAATPEPVPTPSPTAPMVTPTPVPLTVDIDNVSFVGTGYTLYLRIPGTIGVDTRKQVRLVVSDQNGVIKEDSQGFVQARNGDYIGAVVIDRDHLPNPDIEWANANLNIHAIPQRETGMVNARPNPTITKAGITVVPTKTPRLAARPRPTVTPRYTPTQKPVTRTPERFNRNYLETNILQLINGYRVSNGRSALRVDARLSEIARNHSQDMARNNHYSHINLRGDDPTARARRVGYNCHNPLSIGIAENIHVLYGYTSSLRTSAGITYQWETQETMARRFVVDWISSPGHRQNILDSRYGLTGLGVAFGSYNGIKHAIFVTHKFC